jgi:hypothetical protein
MSEAGRGGEPDHGQPRPERLGGCLVMVFSLLIVGVVTVGAGAADESGFGLYSLTCKATLEQAIKGVPGVASVDARCTYHFNWNTQDTVVVVDAASDAEVNRIAEQVLRALATNPWVDSGWSVPEEFRRADGQQTNSVLDSLGFDRSPRIYEVREKWGIK